MTVYNVSTKVTETRGYTIACSEILLKASVLSTNLCHTPYAISDTNFSRVWAPTMPESPDLNMHK